MMRWPFRVAIVVVLASLPAQAQHVYFAAPSAGVAGARVPVEVLPPPPPPPPPPASAVDSVGGPASPVVARALPPPPATPARSYTVRHGGRLVTVARITHVAYTDVLRLNPTLDPTRPLPAGTVVALPPS